MTTTLEVAPSGLLLVDKCPGPTSHDVVAVARRALGTRAVGHTGTLDPMASGLLLVVIGEATKLVNLLSTGDKVYETTLQLGTSTTTLDAGGEVVSQAQVPPLDLARVQAVAEGFVGEIEQRPPAVSAIKVDGKSLYKRVRAGEQVEAPLRRVRAHRLEVLRVEPSAVQLRVACGKGFYVRSLGRDLAEALGTLGHLSALRRTENAGFSVEQAVCFDALRQAARGSALERAQLRARVLPLADICRRLPHRSFATDEVLSLRHGRAVAVEEVECPGEPLVAFDAADNPVAIVAASGGFFRVVRGFCVGT